MIVDTSALLAILFDEPDAEDLKAKLEGASIRRITAPSLAEAAIVPLRKKGYQQSLLLNPLLTFLSIEVIAFTAEDAELALNAYARFGKGNHPAKLNFGDCMTYALAKRTGEALLFKGDDFSKTDIFLA